MDIKETDVFKTLIKQNNYSVTIQRLQLFNLLKKYPALTMKELLEKNSSQDSVTVYRNINLFERLGIITKLRLGWHTKIELSDKFQDHHHHLTCIKCGKHTDIGEHEQLESHIRSITQKHSFRNATHQLEIMGVCSNCK